jgi:hypothetical protein
MTNVRFIAILRGDLNFKSGLQTPQRHSLD